MCVGDHCSVPSRAAAAMHHSLGCSNRWRGTDTWCVVAVRVVGSQLVYRTGTKY